ncbi:MAG: hypothetical protein OXH66_10930, partial [Gemmatimonadetes bacterium]|nr:hypothetical protein [Gemmatimonadota bacterium]
AALGLRFPGRGGVVVYVIHYLIIGGMKLDVNERVRARVIGRNRDKPMLSKEMMYRTGHYWTLWHS